jgi:hypothetical protein
MAILSKGSFSLNLGIVTLGGELSEEDRQCAWELYTELSTRIAVTGKDHSSGSNNFDGELYIESLQSVYMFFQEARQIMRRFPVGRVSASNKDHLGALISRALANVWRPFLEKWQVDFRHWWEFESNPRLSPLKRQEEYPRLKEFLEDWAAARWLMCELQLRLVQAYDLHDISKN